MITKRSRDIFYITFSPMVNGALVSTPIQVAVGKDRKEPEEIDWVNPVIINGKSKLLCTKLAPGYYTPWARIADNPEVSILEGSLFQVLDPVNG